MLGGAAIGALLLEQIDLSVPLFVAAAVAAGSLALLAGFSVRRPSPGG
jgi:predicted MFS family arabinose efflux permease